VALIIIIIIIIDLLNQLKVILISLYNCDKHRLNLIVESVVKPLLS